MISGQRSQDMQKEINRLYYNYKLAFDHQGLKDEDATKIIAALMKATEVIEALLNKKARS